MFAHAKCVGRPHAQITFLTSRSHRPYVWSMSRKFETYSYDTAGYRLLLVLCLAWIINTENSLPFKCLLIICLTSSGIWRHAQDAALHSSRNAISSQGHYFKQSGRKPQVVASSYDQRANGETHWSPLPVLSIRKKNNYARRPGSINSQCL